MPLVVTPNEDYVITALRAFLLSVVPAGVEVVQAQVNRVPEPAGDTFIIMTPVRRMRLATNTDVHDGDVKQTSAMQPTQFDYQLDVHGGKGGDICQIVTTLMRDEYATTYFSDNYPSVSPLYCDDIRQMPFVNAENQYEDRWVIQASLQVDTIVEFPQQSATSLAIDVISVDVEFPAS
jgi:hypothetical protein